MPSWPRGNHRPSCTNCVGWRRRGSRTTRRDRRLHPGDRFAARIGAFAGSPWGAVPGYRRARPAVRDFEEAIRRDPSNPDAYNGRGLARAILGDHQKAVADALIALRMAEPTPRRLYNAARIYAKAAIAATADVRKTGRDAAFVVTRYQDQAVALVRESYNRLPAAQRASFWRDVIQTDPALTVLRRRLRAIEPAGPATSADH